MDFKHYFKGKKVTQLGLGLLGRGVGDAIFLAECGADLIVTDLKSAKELTSSLEKLKAYKNITFVLGEHRLEDFRGRDFILKAAGVPLDSPYIAEARKNGIPIEMDASLFQKRAPKGSTIIGVTGTRGKSTVTVLIYEILKAAGKAAYIGGNIKDVATLPLLKNVKDCSASSGQTGDFVVLELDSWQLQGFGDAKISPHVSVFTTFYPDHMNYYRDSMEKYFSDKENIYKYQKDGDVLVVGEQAKSVHEFPKTAIIARAADVPSDWKLNILGEHNRANVACAIAAARALKIEGSVIRKAVEAFTAVEGRLQFVKAVRGVKIYNDNNSTTPTATVVALKALGIDEKNIVLIMGGADKNLDMSELVAEIPRYCKAVIVLPGTGSDKLNSTFEILNSKQTQIVKAKNLNEAVAIAMKIAAHDTVILFSPAFASFGMFTNEYDRGEKFLKIVESL